ncbi:multidrug efflux system outer membrane protein [Elusimicrobium posterum]|uniref:efflux transporter outer membrane subunit n=1 Tax=Elusimicrobium posterum TaxID=3116653 RepID=UPI003C792F6D
MKKLLILLFGAVLISACSLVSKYKTPEMDLPEATSDLSQYSVFNQQQWWTIFDDEVLNMLEDTALQYNKDLVMAMARVDQARAQAGVVAADRVPSVDLKAGGGAAGDTSGAASTQSYTGSVHVSYELDLWGKYRNLSEAARSKLLATEAEKDVVRLTLTSDVAKTYFAVRTLDSQIATAKRTLESREESVRIYKVRLDNGLIGELDLRRVEAERDSVKAQLLEMQKNLSKNETALSVLIGASPRDIVKNEIGRGKELEHLTLVPDIPSEVPSDILLTRPDVRVAEYNLMAAHANVGAARAAYFPAISLTGQGGVGSSALSNLFSNGLWNFAANLATPIFQGGKIKAEVEEYSAKERELVANYEKTVQNAFKDTYDALTANRINRQTYEAAHNQSQALSRSLDLVKKQYDAGLVSLLDVLDVERNFLSAQINEASVIQNELNGVVDVSKALGGGMSVKGTSK